MDKEELEEWFTKFKTKAEEIQKEIRGEIKKIFEPKAENKSMDIEEPCFNSCPKCGNEDIYRQYYKKDERIILLPYPNSSDDPAPGWSTEKAMHEFVAKKEFIDNYCRCCHCKWGCDVKL